MSDPADPARTGVVAGRVVGVLTASIVVLSLLNVQNESVGQIRTAVELVGIDIGGSVTTYFWLYVVVAAIGRYALCYIVGSLIGVAYDALEEPSVSVVALGILAIGLVDGFAAYVYTSNTILAGAYSLAWLCYVPAFYHYLGVTESQWGETRRLGGE